MMMILFMIIMMIMTILIMMMILFKIIMMILPQTAVGGFELAMLATRLSSLDPIPGMGSPAI